MPIQAPVVFELHLLPEIAREVGHECGHRRADGRQNKPPQGHIVAQCTGHVRGSHGRCEGAGPLRDAEGLVGLK